jgi:hypothetical protein
VLRLFLRRRHFLRRPSKNGPRMVRAMDRPEVQTRAAQIAARSDRRGRHFVMLFLSPYEIL